MLYVIEVPHRGKHKIWTAESKEDFILKVTLSHDSFHYATHARSSFLDIFADEEEAREEAPEAMNLFDAGHETIVEYSDDYGETLYAPAEDSPTKLEVAEGVCFHDLQKGWLLTTEAAYDFLKRDAPSADMHLIQLHLERLLDEEES